MSGHNVAKQSFTAEDGSDSETNPSGTKGSELVVLESIDSDENYQESKQPMTMSMRASSEKVGGAMEECESDGAEFLSGTVGADSPKCDEEKSENVLSSLSISEFVGERPRILVNDLNETNDSKESGISYTAQQDSWTADRGSTIETGPPISSPMRSKPFRSVTYPHEALTTNTAEHLQEVRAVDDISVQKPSIFVSSNQQRMASTTVAVEPESAGPGFEPRPGHDWIDGTTPLALPSVKGAHIDSTAETQSYNPEAAGTTGKHFIPTSSTSDSYSQSRDMVLIPEDASGKLSHGQESIPQQSYVQHHQPLYTADGNQFSGENVNPTHVNPGSLSSADYPSSKYHQQHHLQQQQQNQPHITPMGNSSTIPLPLPPRPQLYQHNHLQSHPLPAPNTPSAASHLTIQHPSQHYSHNIQHQTNQGAPSSPQHSQHQVLVQSSQQQQQNYPQHQSIQQQQPSINVAQKTQHDIIASSNVGTIDIILNSPKAKDEIVEKSPGGRYLRFSEKLGSGAYKNVYRAYDTIEGIEVAWSVINLSAVPKASRQYIVNEVRLLEKLNHSNIISFHGSWVNRELEQVIFVTEILSSGTLKAFINKVQVIRWKIAKRWAIQILKGLEYLHSHEPPIIHRDLKCENIFINGTSGDLRIGDLGLSTVMSNKGKGLSVLGTPEFMAPELYDENYDQTIDIYAFGMCMLEIFSKEVPYGECSNPAQIYKKVTSGIEPGSLSRLRNASARDFIRLCLGRPDGRGGFIRPSASELIHHPFLAKTADDDSEVEIDPPGENQSVSEMKSLKGIPNILSESPMMKVHSDSISKNLEASETGHATTVTSVISERGNDLLTHKFNEKDTYRVGDSIGSSSRNEQQYFASQKDHGPVSISSQLQTDAIGLATHSSVLATANTLADQNNDGKQLLSKNNGDESRTTNNLLNQQYYSIPTNQGVDVIVTQLEISSQMNKTLRKEPDDLIDMQTTEMSTKDVEVLMGRGKDIDREEVQRAPSNTIVPDNRASLPIQSGVGSQMSFSSASANVPDSSTGYDAPQQQMKSDPSVLPKGNGISSEKVVQSPEQNKFLVISAVVEDGHEGNLYVDDVMKLIITLPVEGKQQNVQFDFHLIEDDPVQVAREMVTELAIPEDDLLEISAAISGVARSARVRQGQYKKMQQQGQMAQQQISSDKSNTGSLMPQTFLKPNGSKIQAYPANFSNTMEQNVDAPAFVYENQGGAVMPTDYTTIGDMPELLPQAAAAAVQTHLNEQHLLGHDEETTSDTIIMPVEGVAEKKPIHNSSESLSQQSDLQRLDGTHFVASALSTTSSPLLIPSVSKSVATLTSDDGDSEDDTMSVESDISNSSELRRLKEDYEKNLKRAKKAFLTRMENLQRSKEEKEAQHLKTLEKHEKEKAAFERRLKQAEEEQNQRLKKLEKEWERRMAKAKKSKVKATQESGLPPLAPVLETQKISEATTSLEDRLSSVSLLSMSSASGEGNIGNTGKLKKSSDTPTMALSSNDTLERNSDKI